MSPELFVEMAAVQRHHWWYAARRDILSKRIQAMKLPVSASVLEIGCGTGANLHMLAQHGALSAMEYDDKARALANTLGACEVRPGGLPHDVPFADTSFDLVCMLDVLEHIEHDDQALARVLALARPGGRLLITVPAYQWLWSEHDAEHQHFRRYTASAIQAKALAAGWRVEQAAYFNTLLFPVVVVARLMAKLLGLKQAGSASLPAAPVNTLLRVLFSAERHVVAGRGGFPFGVSVLAVLRRPP